MLIGAGNVVKGGVNLSVPVPSPASVVTSSGSVDEGASITFTSTSVGIPDGTTLYWSMYGYGNATSDADFDSVTGSFTVVNGVGTFPVDIIADNLTEGAQSFSVAVRTESISGAIIGISDTVIINDTSANRPHWTDGDATATGRSYSYRYYKLHITRSRLMPAPYGATQIGELIILNGSTRLTGGTASNPDGHTGAGEGADKSLDGYYDTKWCDTNFDTNGSTSTLIVDFGTAQISNGFTFATANDSYGRDPVQWTFSGSSDGSTWEILHEQLTDASITSDRNTLVSTVFNYPLHGSVTFDGSYDRSIQVAASSVWALGNTCTIEFWVKPRISSLDAPGQFLGGIMSQHDGGGSGIDIFHAGGYILIGDGSSNYTAWPEPAAGVWSHVAAVFPGAGQVARVFINGTEQTRAGGTPGAGQFANTTDGLTIGKRGPTVNFQYYDGKITNVRISNSPDYSATFTPSVLPFYDGHAKLLWTPTDQSVTTDRSDSRLSITSSSAVFSSDYPLLPAIAGNTITSTVTGDLGTYELTYSNTGGTITLITVKDTPTLGSISIVGTSLYYIAPCYQGTFNPVSQKYEGSEIDTFSLYFHGVGGGRVQIAVSVTINHSG
jgi:hypothetical protein